MTREWKHLTELPSLKMYPFPSTEVYCHTSKCSTESTLGWTITCLFFSNSGFSQQGLHVQIWNLGSVTFVVLWLTDMRVILFCPTDKRRNWIYATGKFRKAWDRGDWEKQDRIENYIDKCVKWLSWKTSLYIEKSGFTGVDIIFLIFGSKCIDLGELIRTTSLRQF